MLQKNQLKQYKQKWKNKDLERQRENRNNEMKKANK